MQPVPEKFETERLIIRKYQEGDEKGVFEYASNPEVVKFMSWPIHRSMGDSYDFVQYAIKSFERGLEYAMAIVLKDENKFIGSTGFQLLDSQTAFIGYILNPRYWHKGYATEAIECVYSWLCNSSGLKYITTSCHSVNYASIRILEKIHMPFEYSKGESSLFPNLEGENHEARYYRKVLQD